MNVRHDLSRLFENLKDLEKKQIPFAISVGLNETAEIVVEDEVEQLDKDLENPTPFTKKAFYIRQSNKKELITTVGIKDVQAEYLSLQIEGGIAKPSGFALISPVNVRLNKYGNLSKGKVRKLLAKPNVFSGQVNGVGGIWQRDKRGRLKLLVKYKTKQIYHKRFKFYETADQAAQRSVLKRVRLSLDRALRTAK